MGKIRIDAPRNARIFSTEYCYCAVLATLKTSFCIAYYFNNEAPIQFSLDREMAMYRLTDRGEPEVKVVQVLCLQICLGRAQP